MRVLADTYGDDEIEYLFGRGPAALLAGERAE
jgi:hypothetical protein